MARTTIRRQAAIADQSDLGTAWNPCASKLQFSTPTSLFGVLDQLGNVLPNRLRQDAATARLA
jgi:hypothetical protein